MIKYITRRLLLFVPTFLVITILVFALSKAAPGDPVLLMNMDLIQEQGLGNLNQEEQVYRETARQLGIDKPPFYFSFSSAAYPDTLYRILNREKRENLSNLAGKYGNWNAIQLYFSSIMACERRMFRFPDSLRNKQSDIVERNLRDLYITTEDGPVSARIANIEKALLPGSTLANYFQADFATLRDNYRNVKEGAEPWNCFIPSVRWFGPDNQYHHWLFNCLRGDFGKSLRDGLPVSGKIWRALKITLLLNGTAVFFAFAIAIPIGVMAAARKGQLFDRITTTVLFSLYSLPTFWIGTLLVIFFTTPEYGMDWFPTLGLNSSGLPEDASIGTKLADTAKHMILPVFCLTYSSLAFIARQMRNNMDLELNKPYVTTALAKGLSWKEVIWKHAFRNAMFPIITLIASIFPFLLAGSFIVELIFNISGMGWLTIQSIFSSDWPIVYGILILSTVFTILGILIADLLYAAADPRINYVQKGSPAS